MGKLILSTFAWGRIGLLLLLAGCMGTTGGPDIPPPGDPDCPAVEITLPGVAFAPWDDGTLAMALLLEAGKEREEARLSLSTIELTGSKLIARENLPLEIEPFAGTNVFEVQARFQARADGVDRALRLVGQVRKADRICPFDLTATVRPTDERQGRARLTDVRLEVQTFDNARWDGPPPEKHEQGPEVNIERGPIPAGPPRDFMASQSPPTKLTRLPELPPGAPPYTPSEQGGPSTASFTRLTTTRGAAGLIPPDPSVAASTRGDFVMLSQNYQVDWSTDGGSSFTTINPNAVVDPAIPGRTTFFPNADNGFGCDQVLTWAPQFDLYIWVTQSWSNTIQISGINTAGPNRLRIAWATSAALTADFLHAWSWADVDSSVLGIGNDWLDYPDVTVSGAFLYLSVDRARGWVNTADGSSGSGLVGSRFYSRWSLADMASGAGSIGGAFVELNHAGIVKGHIARNSPDSMIFAGLPSTSSLRLYTLPDSSGTVSWSDVPISSFPNSDYISNDPDGTNWNVAPGGILGAAMTTGCVSPDCRTGRSSVAWFGFPAGRNTAGNRAHPYVRLEAVDVSSRSLATEVDIWNPGLAFATPSLAAQCGQDRCDLAMSLATGGGGRYGENAVGFGYDWLVYITSTSTATQVFDCRPSGAPSPVWCARFGDYNNVIPSRGPSGTGRWFSALGYGVLASTAGTPCGTGGCTVDPHYVQFGHD